MSYPIPKEVFCTLVKIGNNEVISFLDSLTHCCSYIQYWCYSMDHGKVNFMVTDMEIELAGIDTCEKLWDFINNKIDEKNRH